jgi:hypothetical protein
MSTATISRRAPVAFLLAIPVVIVTVAVWPGHMNADTLNEIEHVRTGIYSNWWSPILEWIWHVAYRVVGLGPGVVLLVQTAGFVLGLYLILTISLRPAAAALVAAVIALLPPVMSMLLLVSRDMWFLSAALLAFGCALHGLRASGRVRARWFVASVACIWVSEAARQNALTGAIVLLIMIAGVALAGTQTRRLAPVVASKLRLATAAIALGVIGSAAIYGSQLAFDAAIGTHQSDPQQTIYLYDLEMLSHRLGRNLFPASALPQVTMEKIDQNYTPDNVVPIIVNGVGTKPSVYPITGWRYAALSHTWRTAILDHPLDYLAERFDIFARELSLTENASVVYHPGIDDNPFGYKISNPSLNRALLRYLNAFTSNGYATGGTLDRAWIYLLIATVCALLGAWRRRGEIVTVAVIVLALAAWGLQIGLFFGDMGVGYRLENFTVVAGILALALSLARWATARRGTTAATIGQVQVASERERVPVG